MDWREMHPKEPELTPEALRVWNSLEPGQRPILKRLAKDVWQTYLNMYEKPPDIQWEILGRLVQRGWADPGEVQRRTREVWEWMDKQTDSIQDVIRRCMSSLRERSEEDLEAWGVPILREVIMRLELVIGTVGAAPWVSLVTRTSPPTPSQDPGCAYSDHDSSMEPPEEHP